MYDKKGEIFEEIIQDMNYLQATMPGFICGFVDKQACISKLSRVKCPFQDAVS